MQFTKCEFSPPDSVLKIREQKNLIYVQFYWANQNRYQALVNIRAYSVAESPSVSASSVLSV